MENAGKIARYLAFAAMVLVLVAMATPNAGDRAAGGDVCASPLAAMAPGAQKASRNGPPLLFRIGSQICIGIPADSLKTANKTDLAEADLRLSLNGTRLAGSPGRYVDDRHTMVLFTVERGADDGDAWRHIIGAPRWRHGKLEPGQIGVTLGVGGPGGVAVETGATDAVLVLFDARTVLLGAGALIAALLALVLAASTSSILRDGDAKSTFSLARVQFAFWLYVVTGGYLAVWLMTGDYDGVLTDGTLTLLGITSATTLAAISVGKANAETAAAAAQPAGAAGGPAPIAAPTSSGFWTDILTDGVGIAVHRVQMVVWSGILGGVFVTELITTLRMPNFDSNLLIMMGISSTAYAGLKFREK